MKNFLKIYILFFVTITASCQKKTQNTINRDNDFENFKKSYYLNEDRVLKNKFRVKYYGEEKAFNELNLYYTYNEQRKEEFLPYLLIIVDKHKKFKYCTTIFDNYLDFFSGRRSNYDGTEKSLISYLKNLENIREDQKLFLIYYVKIGAKNNDYQSIRLLDLLTKNNIKVD